MAVAGLAVHAARVWAAPAVADRKLLVVMLRGAYDGASLLVPYSSSYYYEARPTLAVPRPDSGDPYAGIALNSDFALNPSVKDTLLPWWQQKQLAFVPFSGSEDKSRSHFQAQDVMELGQSAQGRIDYASGYLNRLVAALGGGGVSFTQNLTPVFKGNASVPNIALKGGRVGKGLPPRQASLLADLYEGHALQSMANEGVQTAQMAAQELKEEMIASARDAQTTSAFQRQASAMATLMRDRPEYAVAFVDVGGWDTHVNQGSTQGALAMRLAELSRGLNVFAKDLGPAWKNTVVVVMSEFGRTFRENGSRGTDHGSGNTLWIAGGSIQGGQIAGRQTALNATTLYEQRDIPVLNDYRGVLANLFGGMYGLSADATSRVFPGVTASELRLI